MTNPTTLEKLAATVESQGALLKSLTEQMELQSEIIIHMQGEVLRCREMEKITERHLEQVQKALWQNGFHK